MARGGARTKAARAAARPRGRPRRHGGVRGRPRGGPASIRPVVVARAERADHQPPATPADDLDRWLARLDGVHPEPFHAVDRAEFVAALDELAEAMPTMSPAESAVGVMRVAGLLSRERDGHQFALVQPDHAWPMLPLQVYELAEGVVITAARAPYEDLVGSTVVAVGDHPIAEVLAALEPLVPRDGPATVPMFRPGYLLRTIVLRGLGLVPDEDGPIALTVDDGSGERTVEVEPISQDEHVAWAGDFGVLRLPAPRRRRLPEPARRAAHVGVPRGRPDHLRARDRGPPGRIGRRRAWRPRAAARRRAGRPRPAPEPGRRQPQQRGARRRPGRPRGHPARGPDRGAHRPRDVLGCLEPGDRHRAGDRRGVRRRGDGRRTELLGRRGLPRPGRAAGADDGRA